MGGKLFLSTHFESVLSNRHCDLTTLQLCNHSEADTRILLHLAHAAESGHTTDYVCTVDSDVMVLAAGFSTPMAYHSSGWALVLEESTMTFQSNHQLKS